MAASKLLGQTGLSDPIEGQLTKPYRRLEADLKTRAPSRCCEACR